MNRSLALLLAWGGALLAGCASRELPAEYGRRGGYDGGASVNGTAALGRMFERAGYRVESRSVLSPELVRDVDTIVWFPDNFDPPDPATVGWFERWLQRGAGRTLIYVGRDYDAEPDYWRLSKPQVAPADQPRYESRRGKAVARVQADRATATAGASCEWFQFDTAASPRRVGSLAGQWSPGVDANKAELALQHRLLVGDGAERLLTSGEDLLVGRMTSERWYNGQLIVVANGSFLLNAPLVNHEHRKLAARLVDEAAPRTDPARCVFLETGRGPVPILEHEPSPHLNTPLDILKIWPWNVLLLHLAVLGIVFSFSRLPLFGRPRELPSAATSDFGRHVAALGELMAQTGDRDFALARLAHYQQGKDEN